MQQMGGSGHSDGGGAVVDGRLQLKVRCRMSMSLVFDSIWRWREEFQAQGRGSLEAAMKNPTNPDSAAESSASSTHLDSTLMPPSHSLQNQLMAAAAGSVTPSGMSGVGGVGSNHGLMGGNGNGGGVGYSESNYEVFDPLNWMLDGLVDFPYSYAAVQGLEANGLG